MKKTLFIIIILSASFNTLAEPVSIKFEELTVNANLINAEDKSAPFYLILHGTWAWQGMELIASIQELLADEAVGSMAVTLSLGIDNRKGFLGCPGTISAVHQQSYEELHQWFKYLEKLGYKNIILMAHSRGGSQAAGFANAYPNDKLQKLVLLAPMAWNKQKIHLQYQKNFSVNLDALLEQADQLKPQQMMKSIDILYCKKQNVTAESLLSYYSDKIQKNTWDLVKNLPMPVDVFLGSEDPLSKLFSESIANKDIPINLKIKTIIGADHFFRDLYLEDVIESVLDTSEK
jgi:esterase/lipase